jgi:ABC-type lipoprotein export system ATPase subunit
MTNIRLNSIRYREHPGTPSEWTIEGLTFGPINLLVGKNATGKSRALNIVGGLAKLLLSDRVAVDEAGYDVRFSVDRTEVRYVLRLEKRRVREEKVYVGNELKLDRTDNNLRLFYTRLNDWVDHEPSPDEISASARKDKKQHPFLIWLHDWAQSVRHYNFGTALGKDSIAIAVKTEGELPELDDRDQNRVVDIFSRGRAKLGPSFVDAVVADMRELDYPLSGIDLAAPKNITLQVPIHGQLQAIKVREDGVGGEYNQYEMSQGMFRALSVLVQVNYSQMANRANCILIDDIGEGLDFTRSAKLIEMLRAKAKRSEFQLIMATNDQFVMNSVPLDEWSVLQRHGSRVAVRNIHNSKNAFEDFRFVGMSNFAFFEMDFVDADLHEIRQLAMERSAADEKHGDFRGGPDGVGVR